jgi:hypothetical protein
MGRFVEPYLPHLPLGILHLTGTSKHPQARVATTDGQTVEVHLWYAGQGGQPMSPGPGQSGRSAGTRLFATRSCADAVVAQAEDHLQASARRAAEELLPGL